MLVYFLWTLLQFVCCITCNGGGETSAGIAFYVADKLQNRAERVNEQSSSILVFEGVISNATEVKELASLLCKFKKFK